MALADPWLDFTATVLQPPFIRLFWQMVRLPQDRRDPAAAEAARRDLATALDEMARGITADGLLAGQDFGMADIAAGSLMHRMRDIAPDLVAARPAVAAWAARLEDRPAYRAIVRTSYEELRA
jgi:glutathione S-transferase